MANSEDYLRTHPWLTFSADLRRVSCEFWMLLGEAGAICRYMAGVPLRPRTRDNLLRVYLAKGVLGTTAIEGNTLTEEEVLKHLKGDLRLPPSREYLAQEVKNILAAYEDITREVVDGSGEPLTPGWICRMNRVVLENLKVEEEVSPGEVRTYSVGVGRYRGAPAEHCSLLLGRLCEFLETEVVLPQRARRIEVGIIKAIIAHLYLAWIHPFGDGNGRTARTLEFRILVACGVPTIAAHLCSNHYNLTRTEYYRQLDRSSRAEPGDMTEFLQYSVQGLVDGLREQVLRIRDEHREIAWRDFVRERFGRSPSLAELRRKDLVLAFPLDDLERSRRDVLNLHPGIAGAYAGKTRKTLSRDLNSLRRMGLLDRVGDGYVSSWRKILAFVPGSAGRTEAMPGSRGEATEGTSG